MKTFPILLVSVCAGVIGFGFWALDSRVAEIERRLGSTDPATVLEQLGDAGTAAGGAVMPTAGGAAVGPSPQSVSDELATLKSEVAALRDELREATSVRVVPLAR